MRFRRSVVSVLLAFSWIGCGGEVGVCNDPKSGRDTVVSGGKVVFAGQAILNQACASGCHASGAEGAARHGVPRGLDFDLRPVSEDDVTGVRTNKSGVQVQRIDKDALDALSKRRTKVFQMRDSIWAQVEDGLMPPSGQFSQLFASIFASLEADPCTRGRALSKLGDARTREVFRSWLACGAPVVEAEGDDVQEPGAIGTVGFQYPVCKNGEPDGEVTLDGLLAGPLATCSACHPLLAAPDFTSADTVRETVLGNSEVICNGKPFVTPGEPENSFLYDLVAMEDPGCKQTQMPQGGPYLSESELAQLSDWITAGAQ